MRRLQFEKLEDRRLLAGVEFVGPLPEGTGYSFSDIISNEGDVSVSVVGAEMRGESLAVRFRIHTGNSPVEVLLSATGDDAKSGPEPLLIDAESMIQPGRRHVRIDGDTDFVVLGTPETRYIMIEACANDGNWLNDSMSAGRNYEGDLITISIEGAISDIAQGKSRPGSQVWLGADVSGDGFTSPTDALRVINYLNEGKTAPEGAGISFLEPEDVNGDGEVTALDALLVINILNEDVADSSSHDAAFAAYGES